MFENTFQLAPKDTLFVNVGLKIDYEHPLTRKADTVGKFSNKANLGIEKEFDEDREENDAHQILQALYGEAFGALEYEAVILPGVSDAVPDAELNLSLGYEF